MKRFASAFASSALLVLCLAGCGHRPDSGTDDDTASIVLALTTVPSDVSCLEVTVTGAQTTVQRFDVTPNQAATITVPGLASGAATISERAFAVPCAQVTATTTPTWLSTMAVPVTLTPGQITDVTIVLRRAGQVRVTTDFQDGTGATFSVSPAAVAFGNVGLAFVANAVLNITNTGTTAMASPALALAGPDVALFSIQVPTAGNLPCATLSSLPPGAICSTAVRFTSLSTGDKVATLNVGTTAGGAPAATVPLSATGVLTAPTFVVIPNAITFGPLLVGFNTNMVVNITNVGTTAAAPPSLSLSGPDATQFAIETSVQTGNPPCATAASVPPDGACAATIRFSPTSGGAKSATLNLSVAGMVVTTVGVTGTGQATNPSLSASPNPAAFGSVAVGANATITINFTNTGAEPVVSPFPGLSSPDGSQFTFVNGGATTNPPCTAQALVGVGAACAVQIRFAPTSAGAKTASLSIGLTSAGTPIITVPLTGTGASPPATFSASPNPVAFGNLMVGFNASMIVTITNTGTTAVAPPSQSLSGPDLTQFAIQTPANTGNPPCATTASLAPGGACATTIVFSPTTGGAKSATLNLTSGGMVVTTVPLSGTGQATPPSLSASPNPAAFGNVGVGANASITVNLTNNGMVALVPSVGITGPDAAQFAFVTSGNTGNPPCASTTSLPVGASCAVVLRFAPTAAGAKSGSLIVGLTSAGTPIITVPLTGTGVNPTFSATPNPLNLGGVGLGGSSSGIVTITNTSSFATAPPALSISGTNAGQFTIVATTNTGNPPCATTASLPAGGACTTSVRFTPASAGAKTATLNIGPSGAPATTVSLTGTGV